MSIGLVVLVVIGVIVAAVIIVDILLRPDEYAECVHINMDSLFHARRERRRKVVRAREDRRQARDALRLKRALDREAFRASQAMRDIIRDRHSH